MSNDGKLKLYFHIRYIMGWATRKEITLRTSNHPSYQDIYLSLHCQTLIVCATFQLKVSTPAY